MTMHILTDVEQGSEAWMDARRGILTASTIGQLITAKTIKPAANDYSRALTMQLVAERITGHTDHQHVTADMERGNLDEPIARNLYAKHHAPVTEAAFITRDDWGWTLGFSPDGLVGDDGLIEIKSRLQKKQLATILSDTVPLENMAQIQAGLMVTGREWCDYVSYSGGMPLYVKRIYPSSNWRDAILEAGQAFEDTAKNMAAIYTANTAELAPTERIDHYAEMQLS